MKKPKFHVGDKVRCKPNRFGFNIGTIETIEKEYALVNEKGKFYRGGLHVLEHDISSFQVPYTFENDVLVVEIPERKLTHCTLHARTEVYKLYGWAYSLEMEGSDIGSIYSEKQILEKL
jgi:hypothetical protein